MTTRIIAWAEGKTTGAGTGMVANYVVILAVASNPSWHQEIKKTKITLPEYKKIVDQVEEWVFGDAKSSKDLSADLTEGCYKAICKAQIGEFEWDDSVHKLIGDRKFRASQPLRSIIVHLGIANFEMCERNWEKGNIIFYPSALDIVWNKSWANIKNCKFTQILDALKEICPYAGLELREGEKISEHCLKTVNSTTVGHSHQVEVALPRQTSKTPRHANVPWGQGRHVLFYGPPGTGKTRESNRYIQRSIADQIALNSNGNLSAEDVAGTWAKDKRDKILKYIKKFVNTCQFHASYGYEDFIEGLRPIQDSKGELRYETVDGSFLALWRKATGSFAPLKARPYSVNNILEIDAYFVNLYDLSSEDTIEIWIPELSQYLSGHLIQDTSLLTINSNEDEWQIINNHPNLIAHIRGSSWSPENNYYLLIDEINRGKVSKIFGELLFAMAASDSDQLPEVRTQYSKTSIRLPRNLHVIATMNSCDKSVDVLDQALNRRFELRELMPLTSHDLKQHREWGDAVALIKSNCSIDAADFLDRLNSYLLQTKLVDYDRQIGHSYIFKAASIFRKYLEADPKLSGEIKKTFAELSLFRVYFADIFPIFQEFFVDRRDLITPLVPKGFLTDASLALSGEVRDFLYKILDSDDFSRDQQKLLDDFAKFAASGSSITLAKAAS